MYIPSRIYWNIKIQKIYWRNMNLRYIVELHKNHAFICFIYTCLVDLASFYVFFYTIKDSSIQLLFQASFQFPNVISMCRTERHYLWPMVCSRMKSQILPVSGDLEKTNIIILQWQNSKFMSKIRQGTQKTNTNLTQEENLRCCWIENLR